MNNTFKPGDRFYAPWGNYGKGDIFTLIEFKPSSLISVWKIHWGRYNANRIDHYGIINMVALYQGYVVNTENSFYKIIDDKHLMELILKHG